MLDIITYASTHSPEISGSSHMSSLDPSNDRASRRHTHKPNGRAGEDPIRCPYCGQEINGDQGEILARIDNVERSRLARLEGALKQQFSRGQQQAIAKLKTDAEKARRDAVKVAETKLKLLRAGQDEVISRRLAAQRETLGKQSADAIAAEKARSFEERAKLTAQLSDMQARLEQRSAFAIGDPPEIDLFEALKREFPADRIARVGRGSAGADILHDVIDRRGVVAGRIVYDSKAHRRWQSRFVTKLREDVIAHKGDHGVLSTTAFPAV